MAAEAARLDAALPKAAPRRARRARQRVTTAQLAERLAHGNAIGRDVALLIGGPDGLDRASRTQPTRTLRLSDLTLPHALARVLLVEALYRAWSLDAATRTTVSEARFSRWSSRSCRR